MAAVAAAGGEVLIKNVIPKHLECITAKLLEMGVDVDERDDAVLVRRTGRLTRTNVKTLPYPGFPTDMQPQIAAVLCLAEGTSVLTEGVWDNRLPLCGRVPPHGGPDPGGRQDRRHRGGGEPHRRQDPGLRPAGRGGHGDRRPGGPRAPRRSAASTTSSGAMRTLCASSPAWGRISAWW